jgi:hypothetical protein
MDSTEDFTDEIHEVSATCIVTVSIDLRNIYALSRNPITAEEAVRNQLKKCLTLNHRQITDAVVNATSGRNVISRRRDVETTKLDVDVKSSAHSIAPVKGQYRTPLTSAQRSVLKLMSRYPEHCLTYTSVSKAWIFRHAVVTWPVVAALRKKNLIIPKMSYKERVVQQALGTIKKGEYSFILNTKEVSKRKSLTEAQE